MRLYVQRGLSPVRRAVREQLEHEFLRNVVVHTVCAAGKLIGDLQRNIVRLLVQRWLPRVRRRLREQLEHGFVWNQLVYTVRGPGERDGHLRWHRVRILVQRRLPSLWWRVRQQQQHRNLRQFVYGVHGARKRGGHV